MAYTRKTWAETMSDLQQTFDRWDVSSWAVEPRMNPRKIYQSEAERTVTVLWRLRDQDLSLTLGQHPTAAENLRAIYNSLEAMRLIEARGVAELMRQIFKQLPAPSGAIQPTQRPADIIGQDPYGVLGVLRSAPLEVIEAAYRRAAKIAANNNDQGALTMFNLAIEAIRKEHSR
jgi:hypothetical protein